MQEKKWTHETPAMAESLMIHMEPEGVTSGEFNKRHTRPKKLTAIKIKQLRLERQQQECQ